MNFATPFRFSLIACVAAASLGGCATSTHTIGCGSASTGWEQCSDTANRLCGGAGYDVVKRSDDAASVPASYVASDGLAPPAADRWMVVACRATTKAASVP